ncbi:hypothetical protein H4696_002862 [Amycolatopsis lexingtonensis]|uniref:Helix-hairpin-helix domain-containing protein n=1 Tax=Amycolatopsis lexingtonensis TaxID=218822 RepID=A0ABR9HXW1_9PSEU|nr:hypothetical protein [Amycolatopsis lexingtonensis]MBE1495762.1 hypothetical protein [Amycolatopsis lexingtonensis]
MAEKRTLVDVVPSPKRVRHWPAGWWYVPLTILTAGLAAWAPFLHAAVVLGSARLRWVAAAYGAAIVALFVCAVAAPADAQGNPVGAAGDVLPVIAGMGWLALIPVACVHQLFLRRRLAPSRQEPRPEPAITQALAARTRRNAARELAAADPLLARELRIGRPDLPHSYDDGGLVDLNNAPAAIIAQVCEIPLPAAEDIVRARRDGGFSGVDELLVMVTVPVSAWDRIRDRGLTLPG